MRDFLTLFYDRTKEKCICRSVTDVKYNNNNGRLYFYPGNNINIINNNLTHDLNNGNIETALGLKDCELIVHGYEHGENLIIDIIKNTNNYTFFYYNSKLNQLESFSDKDILSTDSELIVTLDKDATCALKTLQNFLPTDFASILWPLLHQPSLHLRVAKIETDINSPAKLLNRLFKVTPTFTILGIVLLVTNLGIIGLESYLHFYNAFQTVDGKVLNLSDLQQALKDKDSIIQNQGANINTLEQQIANLNIKNTSSAISATGNTTLSKDVLDKINTFLSTPNSAYISTFKDKFFKDQKTPINAEFLNSDPGKVLLVGLIKLPAYAANIKNPAVNKSTIDDAILSPITNTIANTYELMRQTGPKFSNIKSSINNSNPNNLYCYLYTFNSIDSDLINNFIKSHISLFYTTNANVPEPFCNESNFINTLEILQSQLTPENSRQQK